MDETIKLPLPEQKHGEANAIRKSAGDGVTKYPLYQAIAKHLSQSAGYDDSTSITLFGVNTREYLIMPCPSADTDPSVLKVVQHLRGERYYAEVYRLSDSMNEVAKYRHCVLVCWDPAVIQKAYAARYYRGKDVRIPCSNCTKQKTGEAATCSGCMALRMWLPGVSALDGFGDPCLHCVKSVSRKGVTPECAGCPTKTLWERRVANGEITGEVNANMHKQFFKAARNESAETAATSDEE